MLEAFVTDWPSPKVRASQNIEELLASGIYATCIPAGPFSQQWNQMLDHIMCNHKSSFVLWCMGDVTPPKDLSCFAKRAVYNMLHWPIDIYAPSVNYSSCQYDQQKLKMFSSGVYEVPATDLLFVVFRAGFLRTLPKVDVALNRNGWMLDFFLTARARRRNHFVLRDYNSLALHPEGSEYDMTIANNLQPWLDSLSAQDREETLRVRSEI